MNLSKFIGDTVLNFSRKTSIFWKPIHVFLLSDKNDNTGKFMMDAYSAKQIIAKHPAIANAKIMFAENYYGETILRVLAA